MKLTLARLARIKASDPLLYKLVFRDNDFSDVSITDLIDALRNNTVVKEIVFENIHLFPTIDKWDVLNKSHYTRGIASADLKALIEALPVSVETFSIRYPSYFIRLEGLVAGLGVLVKLLLME